jgi:hypothetical protein
LAQIERCVYKQSARLIWLFYQHNKRFLEEQSRKQKLLSSVICDQVQRNFSSWTSADYWTFVVGPESNNYTLSVSGYNGDAGDALAGVISPSGNANGMQFTTYDRQNDLNPVANCAVVAGGGWWFNYCTRSNLNRLNTVMCQWTTASINIYDISAGRMLIRQQ